MDGVLRERTWGGYSFGRRGTHSDRTTFKALRMSENGFCSEAARGIYTR
jgi:hypothetical protein